MRSSLGRLWMIAIAVVLLTFLGSCSGSGPDLGGIVVINDYILADMVFVTIIEDFGPGVHTFGGFFIPPGGAFTSPALLTGSYTVEVDWDGGAFGTFFGVIVVTAGTTTVCAFP